MKKFDWSWLPLSLMVMVVYMIQRGFMAVSKVNVTADDLTAAMAAFFLVMAWAVGVIGFLGDRLKAKVMMILAGVSGAFGILMLPVSPLLFGAGFGIAGAVTKLIPFSAPLKTGDKNDAMRISPQAIAKTIGKGLFMIGLAASLKTIGFDTFSSLVAPIWLCVALWGAILVDKHDIQLLSWNPKNVVEILKNYKWWIFTAVYAAASIAYYYVIPNVIPGLMTVGYTKASAMALFGWGMIVLAPLRFGFAWLADKTKQYAAMFLGMVATYIGLIWALPLAPLFFTWVFMAVSKVSTPVYWPTAKNWLGKKHLNTAMGMVLIVSYIIVGLTLGKWE